MAWYKIYAGMSGGFGGANYIGTYEFDTYELAEEFAYREAEAEYQSYEGSHGILHWHECKEDQWDSLDFEPEDEDVDFRYREEIESWIDYEVEEATGPDDIDEY